MQLLQASTPFKFGVCGIFYEFEINILCFQSQHLFNQNAGKHFFSVLFISESWIFTMITPVFNVTWKHYNMLIWFAAQETFIFLLFSILKTISGNRETIYWK